MAAHLEDPLISIHSRVSRTLLPFILCTTITNYVCRTNLEYAALQLNNQLHLDAVQYGTAYGIYFLGFGIFMLPSTFLTMKLGAAWFATLNIMWGGISMATAAIQSQGQLLALRVLLGAAQAGGTTSMWHLLSQFYSPSARNTPMAVYTLGQVTAMAAAPLVSAVILQRLSGWLGLAGWRWLLIIEGLPSVFLGLAMLLWLPSSPLSFSALQPDERELLHAQVHGSAAAADAARQSPRWSDLPGDCVAAIRTMNLLLFCALGFGWMACMATLFSWMPQIVSNALSGTMTSNSSVSNSNSGSAAGRQQTTEVLLLTIVPYATAAAAIILLAWMSAVRARRRSRSEAVGTTSTGADSKDASSSSSSSSSCGAAYSFKHCLLQHRHTRMDLVALPLFLGSVALLCLLPAYSTSPQAAFALLCLSVAAGFSANSTMCSEASKAAPSTKSAGVGLSLFNLFVALGGLTGPMITGAVVQSSGSFSLALPLAGLGMAATGMLAAARGIWEEVSAHRALRGRHEGAPAEVAATQTAVAVGTEAA